MHLLVKIKNLFFSAKMYMNKVNQVLNLLRNNQYVSAAAGLALVTYVHKAAPALPSVLEDVMDNVVGKAVYLTLVLVVLGRVQLKVAAVAAVAVVAVMTLLSGSGLTNKLVLRGHEYVGHDTLNHLPGGHGHVAGYDGGAYASMGSQSQL